MSIPVEMPVARWFHGVWRLSVKYPILSGDTCARGKDDADAVGAPYVDTLQNHMKDSFALWVWSS